MQPLFVGAIRKRGLYAYSAQVAADSPLLWWRLNESSGAVAVDAGSGGRAGAYAGGHTQQQPSLGKGDSASILLNGSSGAVENSAAAWSPGNQFTVEILASISGQGSTEADFLNSLCSHLSTDGKYGWTVDYNYSTGKIDFYVANNGAFGTDLLSAAAISLNTPYLITCAQDATTRYLYINGVLSNSVASVYVPGVFTHTAVGKRSSMATRFLKGGVGEVSIYSGALSAARIAAHAAAL